MPIVVWQYVPLEFHDPKSVDEMVNVNLVSLIKVTQKFLRESSLPKSKEGRGGT
jgi:short-subunit dehydrogenase